MHSSTALLPLTLLASYASAQTTSAAVPTALATGASGACRGQNVLDACLSSTTAIANACQSTDYTCLCTSWNAVLTCYNECPDDAGYAGALSNKQTYCNNASVYSSTSSPAISRDWPSSTAADAAPTDTDGSAAAAGTGFVTTGSGGGSASKTASATGSAQSDKSNGGQRVGGGVGGGDGGSWGCGRGSRLVFVEGGVGNGLDGSMDR